METTHSPQFKNLKKRYTQGRISANMLCNYVKVGRIDETEYNEITGFVYPATE